MSRFFLAAALLALSTFTHAQTAGVPPQPQTTQQPATPAKNQATKPKDTAPGSGPDKVWVNLNSSVYHCPGDRYYGKTANGRYMAESAARSAGAKGAGGKTCFATK